MNTPTPESIARAMSRAEIRERVERITRNLANPAPACRGASRNAARKDAAQALRIYRAALALSR